MSAERRARGRLAESLPDPPLVAVPGGAGGEDGPAAEARAPETDRRSCPEGRCDGSGWLVGEDDVAVSCGCRQQRAERARARGVSATLPRRFQGVSFERPPVSEMARDAATRRQVADVRAFCDEIDTRLAEGAGLWLEGGPGTGKTTLAMLTSKAALDAGHTAAIYSLPGLLARIRRTFEGEAGEDDYFTFFNRLASVDLLHLDDLGAENRTEWVLEQLYAIIDRRYSDQRSIVVTTNLNDRELTAQLGDRIVSRLTEICGDPLMISGEDRRIRLAPGSFGIDEA